MGVYIKGMEMPKRGESCLVITITPDGEVYKNVYDASFRVNQLGEAVPVPPHGRLIDADAFEDFIRKDWDKNDHWIADVVYSRPTIIPAEEGE